MSAQAKALQLADLLETVGRLWEDEAAEELRRLHQSEKEAWRYADELEQERKRLIKAAEMALEALEITWATECGFFDNRDKITGSVKALRQALAEPANSTTDFVEPKTPVQPEQEPEWIEDGFGTMWQKCGEKNCGKFVVKIGKVDCWNGDCPEEKNT
jgi:hypothetical protein